MGDFYSAVYFNIMINEAETRESPVSIREDEFPQFPKFRDYEAFRCLPILEVSMTVEVISTVSQTTLRQTFVNFSAVRIREADYTFPLYDGAAIVSFECSIGDRVLKSRIKRKADAKAEYKKALAEQRVTALLEEHTPEVFETRLGNIPPKSSVKVEIVFVGKLKQNFDGGATVTIPTSVAPRYETLSSGLPDNPSIGSAANHIKGGLKIEISVISIVPIRKLESLTHPITVEIGISRTFNNVSSPLEPVGFDYKKARATFSDQTATLGKDFVLTVTLDVSSPRSQALLEASPDQCSGPAVMVTVCPRELFSPQHPTEQFKGEIIFVADRSGSMSGGKMKKLREAMNVFLMNLPKQCIFNIYSFGSILTSLWQKSEQNSQETLEAAKQHISSFNADMGGKMILPILNCIVEERLDLDASTTQVILLTDGEVQNTEEIANFVAKAVRASKGALRFFPLGIGYADSHRLVEGISQQGGGFGEVIVLDRQEQLAGIVTRILEGALSPWKFEITLSGHFKSGVTSSSMQVVEHPARSSFPRTAYIQAPYCVHSLNPFAWSTIFFLFHDKQNTPLQIVTVKATTVSGNFEYKDIQVDYAQIKSSTIHQVGAKSIMLDLEAGQSWTHTAACESDPSKSQEPISNLAIGKEAECIGLKWSIAGKWTSFVAVDRNTEENIAGFYRAPRSEQGPSGPPVPVGAVGEPEEKKAKEGREPVEMKAKEKEMPDGLHIVDVDPGGRPGMGRRRERADRAPMPPPNSGRRAPPPPPLGWIGPPPGRKGGADEVIVIEDNTTIKSARKKSKDTGRVLGGLFGGGGRKPSGQSDSSGQSDWEDSPALRSWEASEVWPGPLVFDRRTLYLDLLLGLLLFIILENAAPSTLICCLAFLYLLYWRWQTGLFVLSQSSRISDSDSDSDSASDSGSGSGSGSRSDSLADD
jgi:hypothetical protein